MKPNKAKREKRIYQKKRIKNRIQKSFSQTLSYLSSRWGMSSEEIPQRYNYWFSVRKTLCNEGKKHRKNHPFYFYRSFERPRNTWDYSYTSYFLRDLKELDRLYYTDCDLFLE